MKKLTRTKSTPPPVTRNTTQRNTILAAFREADRPLSPTEVLDRTVKKIPRVGLTTVYRTIKKGLEDGVLETVSVPGQPPRYEVAGKKHHHHFLCRRCDRLYEVDRCFGPVTKYAPPGFTVDDHHITLYGICKSCR